MLDTCPGSMPSGNAFSREPSHAQCFIGMERSFHGSIIQRPGQKQGLTQVMALVEPQNRESNTPMRDAARKRMPVSSSASRTTPSAAVSPTYSAPPGIVHRALSARWLNRIRPASSITAASPADIGVARVKMDARRGVI
jgi:hypothetical protein